ncbi:MAG: hypothetical protein JXA99_15015 [Candidatus Lokiarchaeota archaeon]|nr:hypothetical protein [Candidatus Lokiarchaeota archaeon]
MDRDLNSAINVMVSFLFLKKVQTYDFLLHHLSMNEESFLKQWRGFLQKTDRSVRDIVAYS